MKTILIVGASRGIGLELVRQYLEAGERVIDAAGLERLRDLGAQAMKLDVTNPASVSGLSWQRSTGPITWPVSSARTTPSHPPRSRRLTR